MAKRDNREFDNEDRLEGRNSVIEALKSGRDINKIRIADQEHPDPRLREIENLARARKIVVVKTSRAALDKMSVTGNHQGVIASVASHEYCDLDTVISRCVEEGRSPFIVVLDELKDSYNLGSVLRISDAAGVDAVVIPKHRSVGLDAAVAKASAGAIEYVPVARVTNIASTLRELKKDHGFWIMGTAAEGTVMYDKADYKGPIAIVIGSEGEGIREHVRKECDFLLSIPMAGKVNSLNAAVACGIVVFEAAKARSEGR